MATAAKRLYKGTASTTVSTAYTVPSSTLAIIKNVILTNKSNSDVTVTVVCAGTEIIYQYKVTSKETVILDLSTVIHAGELIQVSASASNSINVYISGVEVV